MRQPELTHHVQLEILKRMLPRAQSRYSEIKPASVEANLFVYHLKQLIKNGLIEKIDKNYVLSRTGKQFVDRATLQTMKLRVQPKLITILMIKRGEDWLIMERLHQPFMKHTGFPSGKVHFGEKLAQAAQRELFEKSGLQNIDLQLRGNIIMRFKDGDDFVNHINGYVFYGETSTAVNECLESENFKTYFDSEKALHSEPCLKGHQELLDLMNKGDEMFFAELDFSSDY